MMERSTGLEVPPGLQALYSEPNEVRDALQQLFGVDEAPFLRAIGAAWLEWASHSEFDAPSFPGTLLWGHTVRHERRELSELGWGMSDANNFALSVTPDRRMAIAVETGDRFTGVVGLARRPRTNSRKGVKTLQMIEDNRHLLQGEFFPEFGQCPLPGTSIAKPSDAPLLWIHLIRQSMGDVASEISLPIVANDHHRIVGWRTRIILSRWRGSDDPDMLRTSAPEAAPDAALRIVRRVA